jgi:hypothetical protein
MPPDIGIGKGIIQKKEGAYACQRIKAIGKSVISGKNGDKIHLAVTV